MLNSIARGPFSEAGGSNQVLDVSYEKQRGVNEEQLSFNMFAIVPRPSVHDTPPGRELEPMQEALPA